MHINRNSWHFKWYRWTYTVFDTEWRTPDQTNLCQYCQRIFWSTVGLFFLLLCKLVIGAVYYLFLTPLAFIVGLKPRWIFSHKQRYESSLFDEYDGLWGWVYPWNVGLAALFLYIEYAGLSSAHYHKGFLIGDLTILAIVAITIGTIWFFDDGNETGKLIRAWTSAKKSRFCPIVEFTDEPTSTDVNEPTE